MKSNMIYPCLWFDGNAKDAADFYCSVFDNSVITYENQMVVIFESSGQKFMCLNGGPEFTINPSVSFYVLCETEEEINRLWKNLLEGGFELMPLDKYEWSKKYVWLQDKFGVNWQLSFGGMEKTGQKISPVLMFTDKQAGKAEQAVQFYTSVFTGSGVIGIVKYDKDDNDVEGTVKHAEFTLNNQAFMAMDSSFMHEFSFNEAVSLVVDCETQEEIDYFWERLTEGGEEIQCGWLKDRFGVSWQIVSVILYKLMSDPLRSERVTRAFLQMKKFEIEKLIMA
jgi:predicted 3-demethylubiquinone-9 3-methyltransferase (glyoxalase superfamily)